MARCRYVISGVEEMVQEALIIAEREGWEHVSIPQPVSWPEVNGFLNDIHRPGEYFSYSRVRDFKHWKMDTLGYLLKTYEQHFYISDKAVAFEFKLLFG